MTGIYPTNFLSAINFKFQIARSPNVNFFVQKVNIPGFSLASINVNNPLLRIPYPGEHLMYEELEISFKVDEYFQNYLEIYNWLKGIGKQEYNSYATINSNPIYSGRGINSDITLTVLTSERNPNYKITFKDAFPISLSSLVFDSALEDVTYIDAQTKFKYTSYDIAKTT